MTKTPEQSIDDLIKFIKRKQKSMQPKKTQVLAIRITDEEHFKIKKAAERFNLTISDYVRSCLRI